MGLSASWRRLRKWSPGSGRRQRPASARAGHSGAGGPDSEHLAAFAARHPGAEAYLEPPTGLAMASPSTLLLVAGDGEWTRRPVPDARAASDFTRRAGIPLYDVNLTGYPQRVRDWTARQRREASSRTLPS